MKQILIIIISLFFYSKCYADNLDSIIYSFHNQLNKQDFINARKSMNKLKRNWQYQILSTNNSFLQEYIYQCSLIGLTFNIQDEVSNFIDMLENVYIDEPKKFYDHIVPALNCCCRANDGNLAFSIYNKIIQSKTIKLTPEELTEIKYNIAWAYNYSSSPYLAYKLFKECADSYLKTDSTLINYAKSINGIAYVSRYLGKDYLMLPIYMQIDSIYKNYYGELSYEYAINCDNIGGIFKWQNNPNDGYKYMSKCKTILEHLDNSPTDLVKTYNNLACCLFDLGQKDSAYHYLDKSILIDSTNYLAYLNYGSFLKSESKFDKALEFFHKLSITNQKTLCADKIGDCYAKLEDYTNYRESILDYFEYIKSIYSNNIRHMNEKDRFDYCSRIRDSSFDSLFKISNKLKTTDFLNLCFDILLFLKSQSISFNQNIEFIVESSQNEILKSKYANLLFTKAIKTINPYKYNPLVTDSLEFDFINTLQQEYDITSFLQTTHSDIIKELNNFDIAIEFYAASHHDNNNIYAIILKHDGSISIQLIGNSSEFNKLSNIWNILSPHIGNACNIYFSPDGLLHSLPIESYATPNTSLKLYRLSSTRELLKRRQNKCRNTAVIYGDLIYDLSNNELTEDANRYHQFYNSTDLNTPLQKYRGVVEDLQRLEGSQIESNRIINILKKKNIKVSSYLKKVGTESSFKNLNGKKQNIIHIATHGFYNKPDSNINNFLSFNNTSITNIFLPSLEDDILMRSGLYLAGANNAFIGEDIPNNIDDGILTAYEISLLDFRGLDLVTLSACETGRGDITGDGVYGLQRGFKKAGARSILMSLWKVDDDATCLLMTEFYKNWIGEGKTKYESLELAKKTVRSHKEWQDPEYWAAFILLDALD